MRAPGPSGPARTTLQPEGMGGSGPGGLVPEISGVDVPVTGNAAFGVKVSDARANTAAVLLLGMTRDPLALGGGCTLYLGLPIPVALAATTDGAGEATISLPVPNDPALVGGELFTQWAVADPTGALFGVASLSDALHVVIGD